MDRSLVARATSSDETPTPAYLFGEIAQMTHANFEGCRQLTVYLLERMKKPNHNIKFKCLQIVKHVCLKGRSDFKIGVAREAQTIKDCLTFSGPPDPLRGEEIYRKVREAAKEALDAVFAETPPQTLNSHPRYASGNRIEGFGSGGGAGAGYSPGSGGPYGGGNYGGVPYEGYGSRAGATGAGATIGAVGTAMGAAVGKAMGSLRGRSGGNPGLVSGGNGGDFGGEYGGGYGGGGAGRGSSMQGMGNYDPSKDKTWLERTSDSVRGSVGTGIDVVSRRLGRGGAAGDSRYVSHNGRDNSFPVSSYMTNRGPNAYEGSSYRPEAVSSAYEAARASSQTYASQWNQGASSSGHVSIGSGVRGGWGGDNSSGGGGGGGGVTPAQYHTPDPAESYGGGRGVERGFVGRTGGGDSDGGYEGKLVEEICAAGGTKSTPGKPELDAFLSKAASLDPGRVADALVSVLGAADWRARSKGLSVVEALHRSDPSYRIPLEDAFQDTERGVIPLCADSKPAVRDRAVRVSKLLGLDPSPSHQDGDPSQANTNPNTNNETTDTDTNNGYARAPDGEPGQTTAAPSGPPVDLLGGLEEEEEGVVRGGGDRGGVVPGERAAAAGGRAATGVEVNVVDLLDGGGGGRGAGERAGGGGEKGIDDILGLGGSTTTPATTPAAVTSTSPASATGNDVSTVSGDPPESSLFEDLSVKDAGRGGAEGVDSEDRDPAPKLASVGSGFAFMASAEEASPEGKKPMEASSSSAGPAHSGGDLLSGFGGDEKASPSGGDGTVSGLDMLVMSPTTTGVADARQGDKDALDGRKRPTGDDLLTGGITNGGKGVQVSTTSPSVSLLDWAAGEGEKKDGVGSKASPGSGGADGSGMDRNELLQQKVMLMQQQQQQQKQQQQLLQRGGVFGMPGTSKIIPGAGAGLGIAGTIPTIMQQQQQQHQQYVSGVLMGQRQGVSVGVGMMRAGSSGQGKTIPVPRSSWGPGSLPSVGGQRGHPQTQQRRGDDEDKVPKASDSFSFVRDAMQDSIK